LEWAVVGSAVVAAGIGIFVAVCIAVLCCCTCFLFVVVFVTVVVVCSFTAAEGEAAAAPPLLFLLCPNAFFFDIFEVVRTHIRLGGRVFKK
jgi:hypothetical protein